MKNDGKGYGWAPLHIVTNNSSLLRSRQLYLLFWDKYKKPLKVPVIFKKGSQTDKGHLDTSNYYFVANKPLR